MSHRFPLLGLLAAVAASAGQDENLPARTKGASNAPVTVYEMSDFQCPFCKKHAEETFPTLEREYVRTGKVRWIYINFPLTSLHPNAVAAAEFAMCAARQDRFWAAHDILFERQRVWAPLRNPGPFLVSLGDSIGLRKAELATCLEKGETRAAVQRDAQGAVRAGAQSTPTFYVEGGLLTGAHPVTTWRPILDSIVAVKTGRREDAKTRGR